MTKTTAQLIGERISDELYRRRVAKRTFATKVGMSRTGLYRRLTGATELTVSEVEAIARELDVSVEWVLGREPVGSAA
jgi:transcriptional regulator with XRE-family HTH domain